MIIRQSRTLCKGMPAFPLSHACIVTDKLQQIPPFDRLRTPLWVGKVQWRRGAKHATTRVQSHPPSTPSPRDAFSQIRNLQALYLSQCDGASTLEDSAVQPCYQETLCWMLQRGRDSVCDHHSLRQF